MWIMQSYLQAEKIPDPEKVSKYHFFNFNLMQISFSFVKFQPMFAADR